jgi:SNF2 family DNA or RNA helicase
MPRKIINIVSDITVESKAQEIDRFEKDDFQFHRPPMDHQLRVFERSKDAIFHGYLMDMGTGKTKVTIDNVCYLHQKAMINAFLVVAPKGMYHQWAWGQNDPKKPKGHRSTWDPDPMPPGYRSKKREWDKDATEYSHSRSLVYVWNNSCSAANLKQQDFLFKSASDMKILVMNTEAFSTPKGAAFAEKFVRKHKTLMAVDEASLIKHHTAKRTKSMISTGGYAAYRRILTGTPISNSPLDVFGFESFLDYSIFGKSWFAFRSKYAVLKDQFVQNRSFKVVTGYKNLDEMKRRLDQFNTRISKGDCMDLPPKLYMPREVPLTPEQEKMYTNMHENAVAYLNDLEYVTATIVLSQLTKMRQILCGYIKDDDGVVHPVPTNRITAVLEIIEELDGKVVIWCPYRQPLFDLAAELKKAHGPESYGLYMGAGDGVDVRDRGQTQDTFNDPDSKMRFLLLTYGSGKYGLNLTCVKYSVRIALDYDLDALLQSEDRCHGKGRGLGEEPQTYIDLVSPGTVDEKIVESLIGKKSIADLITGDKWRAFLTNEELF